MNFLDKLLGRSPAQVPAVDPLIQAFEVPPRPVVNVAALDAASKRLGMWVVDAAGVGILTGARANGDAEVTLIKPDGSTVMTIGADDKAVPHVVTCPLNALRQARIHEIPESRRGDPAQLAALGYQP